MFPSPCLTAMKFQLMWGSYLPPIIYSILDFSFLFIKTSLNSLRIIFLHKEVKKKFEAEKFLFSLPSVPRSKLFYLAPHITCPLIIISTFLFPFKKFHLNLCFTFQKVPTNLCHSFILIYNLE